MWWWSTSLRGKFWGILVHDAIWCEWDVAQALRLSGNESELTLSRRVHEISQRAIQSPLNLDTWTHEKTEITLTIPSTNVSIWKAICFPSSICYFCLFSQKLSFFHHLISLIEWKFSRFFFSYLKKWWARARQKVSRSLSIFFKHVFSEEFILHWVQDDFTQMNWRNLSIWEQRFLWFSHSHCVYQLWCCHKSQRGLQSSGFSFISNRCHFDMICQSTRIFFLRIFDADWIFC